jgi:hypothetical protein
MLDRPATNTRCHAGVAEQALHGGGVEDRPVDEPALPAVFEVVEGGDDVEVGPVAAPAAVLLVVEVPAAHVDQGVATSLGGAAGGFPVDVAGLSQAEGGGDDITTFGIEAA